ncbi:MAG: methylmalonyl Co-A mutase-associated GTPase MeaB [Bacteroidetes bacterium]|nr:MAG: methylmalonyl Co-A mutase-associated GTPase MeaB [Bacteroidota bacterium]
METRISALAEKVRARDRVGLAQALSLAESLRWEDLPQRVALLRAVSNAPPTAYRIGFTGAPGAGKSTLIDALGAYLLERFPDSHLAILTVDPSSWRSGGSLLADQTRMRRLAAHPRAFLRTFASGGHLGGLHPRLYEALTLCEAAGFTWIFIESVGTGQSEIELRYACDFLLYVALPHGGDELQGLKRGLMEALDGIALNKADTLAPADLNRLLFQLETALQLLRGGEPFVVPVSALTGEGLPLLWEKLLAHQPAPAQQTPLRQEQTRYWLLRYWQEALEHWLQHTPQGQLRNHLLTRLEEGEPFWTLLEEIAVAFGLFQREAPA